MNSLQTELNKSTNVVSFEARRGQLAAAKFMGAWHRVKIEAVKNKDVEVQYIDFGNVILYFLIIFFSMRPYQLIK